jgi:hypothetical protein
VADRGTLPPAETGACVHDLAHGHRTYVRIHRGTARADHHLISSTQYTELVTVIVLSAFVPTLIAQQLFQPDLVDTEEPEAERRDEVSR